MSVQIRKFTPSLLDGATLERLYVERGGILDDIVERVSSARSDGGLSHVLVFGPRGAGKTHLISLVHHRLRSVDRQIPIAWLVEDPYDILSFHDLVAAIVERANPSIEPGGSSTDHLEQAITATARERGPVVVLAENFDEILEQLGDLDQQRLRRLIESESCLQLVVTTTAVSGDLAEQPAPFYGFFNHKRLEPFTTDQAVDYLIKRALVQDDTTFADQLTDPEHRETAERRVQSIEQLAGGQPRIWALLAEGLTFARLDDLVSYMIGNFDDITPYYQSQLRQLAALQRKIVMTMVRQDCAVTAKDLAHLIETTPTTITKTLRDLHERGWVQPVDSPLLDYVDGRLTFYELSEPLLRLALELKDNRRHEIGTILDFVKLWFDPSEIQDSSTNQYAIRAVAEVGPDDKFTATRWMLGLDTADVPSLRMLGVLFDATLDLHAGDGARAFALPNVLRHALESSLSGETGVVDILHRLSVQAISDAGHVPTPDTRGWLERHCQLIGIDGTRTDNRQLHVRWLGVNWDFDHAAVVLGSLEATDPGVMLTSGHLATRYWSAGRVEEAIALEELVLADRVELLGGKHPHTLMSRNNLASYYSSAGRVEEAIALQELVLADRVEVLGDKHPGTLTSRNNLANSYSLVGRIDEALALHELVLADRSEVLGGTHPDTLMSRGNLASSYRSTGRFEEAISLDELVLAAWVDLLGDMHPNTLIGRGNLACSYRSAGRVEEAIALHELVVADSVEVWGDKHPDTLIGRGNLASSYWSAGRVEEAVALQELVLADRVEVLGDKHPDTLASSENLERMRSGAE